MNICFITHISNLYGANRSLLDMIDGLSGHGVIAHVICPEYGELSEQLDLRSIPYLIQPIARWVAKQPSTWQALKRIGTNISILPAIIQQLREWRIDITHTNSSVIPVGFLAAKLYGCPHVWHVREFCDLDYQLFWDWGFKISRSMIAGSDRVIANSKATYRHHFQDSLLPNHAVMYNGIAASEEFESRRLQNNRNISGKSTFTFMIIGYLIRNKGQHRAINALSKIAHEYDVCLRIVGDGERSYTQYCHHMAQQLGIADQVVFVGYSADPRQEFRNADAVLMCSKHEAMGRVTIETMSMAKPVIGYDDGGTSELIEDGHTGLLFSGGELELADCMRRLLNDRNYADELGQNGWEWARSRFTNEKFAEQVHDLYCELLCEKSKIHLSSNQR